MIGRVGKISLNPLKIAIIRRQPTKFDDLAESVSGLNERTLAGEFVALFSPSLPALLQLRPVGRDAHTAVSPREGV